MRAENRIHGSDNSSCPPDARRVLLLPGARGIGDWLPGWRARCRASARSMDRGCARTPKFASIGPARAAGRSAGSVASACAAQARISALRLCARRSPGLAGAGPSPAVGAEAHAPGRMRRGGRRVSARAWRLVAGLHAGGRAMIFGLWA